MKKIESIFSENFAVKAIQPSTMSEIYGGDTVTKGGSKIVQEKDSNGNETGCSTTITWTSDTVEHGYTDGKSSGCDAPAKLRSYGNPFDNPVNLANRYDLVTEEVYCSCN